MSTFEGFVEDDEVWTEAIEFEGPDEDAMEAVHDDPKREVMPEFAIARWLHGRGYQRADECKAHIHQHCEMNDTSFDDFWIAFEDVWDLVKYADNGRDNFEDAVTQMRKELIEWPAGLRLPSEQHHQAASTAVYLSQYTNGNPFVFPLVRLRVALGLELNMSVCRIRRWLTTHQLIECVDSTWSQKGRKAKKYILGYLLIKRNQEETRQPKKPEDFGSAFPGSKKISGWQTLESDCDVPF